VKDGHRIVVVLRDEGPLSDRLSEAGVNVLHSKHNLYVERASFSSVFDKVGFLLRAVPSFFAYVGWMRKFKPDVVHINTALLPVAALASRVCRVPVVWHVRESFGEFGALWIWYERYMRFFASRIIAVSMAMADQFKGGLKAKVQVLYNGFTKDEFESIDPARVEAFKEQFIQGKYLLVGLVGRIKFERKGQEVFVEAVAKLKPHFPDVRYLLIGSPFPGNEDHLHRLEALIRHLNLEQEIILTGDVKDIKAAYAALDISVMASGLPEPFGGVVIESMAMGLPVVGTSIGGTSEQVEDGVTGYLVPPKEPDTLADALRKLLSDSSLREEMGKRGRARFEQRFEFEIFYSKMLQVYKDVLI
jgi:glycosyltransferase involved in cell wall biosynthesis